MNKIAIAAVFLALAVLLGCGQEGKKIRLGSKNYTEQYIAGEIFALMLEENGFEVERKFGMSSNAARQAMEQKQVDIYSDYTGTAWATWLGHEEKTPPAADLYQQVKNEDKERFKVDWLGRFPFNNTYALAVRQEIAQKYQLKTLDDLAQVVNRGEPLTIAVDYDFFERADGVFGMATAYDMNLDRKMITAMETGLTYIALDKGDVDVAMVYTTDGRLRKFNLVVLEDNREFFPPYNLAILAQEDIVAQYPELKTVFAPLWDRIDDKTMLSLNYQVDIDAQDPDKVARNFLTELGLIQK